MLLPTADQGRPQEPRIQGVFSDRPRGNQKLGGLEGSWEQEPETDPNQEPGHEPY